MNTHSKGSVAEHLASAALIYNGYQVYAVDHPTGPTDIIAEKEGVLFRCQIKSFYFHKSYGKPTTKNGKPVTRPGYRGYGYKVVEMCTSNVGNHQSYIDLLTDVLIAVDVDSAEVIWYELTPDSPRVSMNKNSIMSKGHLLYPVKDVEK